jgi:membrane associated rhomboid family serine protease
MSQLGVATAGVSGIFYAILVGIPAFDPGAKEVMVQAFGERPLGLPVRLVVVAALTLLYAPAPWVCWHFMRLSFQAREDGLLFGLSYLMSVGRRHPELRRSQYICLLGLAYFCVICGSWIVYTAMRGI